MMQVWNGATGGVNWIPYKPEYVFCDVGYGRRFLFA